MEFVSDIYQNGSLTTPINEVWSWLREEYLCHLITDKKSMIEHIRHKLNAVNARYPECPQLVVYENFGDIVIRYAFDSIKVKRLYIRLQDVKGKK